MFELLVPLPHEVENKPSVSSADRTRTFDLLKIFFIVFPKNLSQVFLNNCFNWSVRTAENSQTFQTGDRIIVNWSMSKKSKCVKDFGSLRIGTIGESAHYLCILLFFTPKIKK